MIEFLNPQEKHLNDKIMGRMDKKYDREEAMITQWRGEHGYHSTLVNQMVHPTYDSLSYAYERMNRGTEEDFEEAIRILHRVVPLQDTNSEHDTYGIWPYFMEETLEQMAPPDWNWADFCGKKLLQILIDYKEHIPADLAEMMHQAIIHSCNSIIRRNMGPHYTNISIMGTLVTMVAGEQFGEDSLVEYAKRRLDGLYAFNIGHGAFQEYNSPSYTWVVIDDLASMIPYIKDKEAVKKLEDISGLAWKCIADHFHYKTKQWAGPHARFYGMLEDTQLLMRIQRALSYQISLVPLDEEGLDENLPIGFFSSKSVCPTYYEQYFINPTKENQVDAVFIHGEKPWESEIAVCYQNENFNLGTFYKSNFWNQKRNHISYFGTEEEPVYCSIKCLHDFYDYSSGLIVTSQDKARAVSVTGFGTNGGDTHCNLDMVEDATIKASDLRLRFEIGGATDQVSAMKTGDNTFDIEIADACIRIAFPYAEFGDNQVELQITKEAEHVNETGGHKDIGSAVCIDAILYHGEETDICFTDLTGCCCAITFEVIPKGGQFAEPATASIINGQLVVEQAGLKAEGPQKACTMEAFKELAKAYRDGKEYQEIYLKKHGKTQEI